MAMGEAESFLVACARQCFLPLNKLQLQSVARNIGLEFNNTDTLYQLILKLLAKTLKNLDEEATLAIMAKRVAVKDAYLDILAGSREGDAIDNDLDREIKKRGEGAENQARRASRVRR